MRRIALIGGILSVLALVGLVFLASWEPPAPTEHVEKVLPDDRFPQ